MLVLRRHLARSVALTRIGRKASLLLFQSARPHRFCHSAASTPQLATPRKAKHSVLDKESQDGVLAALRHLKMNRALKGMASKDHAVEDAVWDRAFAALKRVIFSGPTNYSARFPSGMDFETLLWSCRASHARYVAEGLEPDFASRGPRVSKLDLQLYDLVLDIALEDFSDFVLATRAMRETADMRLPHTWYPIARTIKRRIIYHAGPTNSGKTYSALQRLKEAETGLYCGPLRLLALEVHEALNSEGIFCNLITGQEKKYVPYAVHVSCTVEMSDVSTFVEVAVIDEIQMIGDQARGWAWTRALLGIPAAEIHVCGNPSAIEVVKQLVRLTGDDLTVQMYDRRSPLTVAQQSLGYDLKRVMPGDCIISFSRKDIYALRASVQQQTGHRCCVVYGALPPETRSGQAQLFNDPTSGFDVLIASDAIGMGLNLNIRRIIFASIHKHNGDRKAMVTVEEMKQIGGRAGRAGGRYPVGEVTTLAPNDLPFVRKAFSQPSPPIQHAGLFPTVELLEQFAACTQKCDSMDINLADLMDKFVISSQLDKQFIMCRHEEFTTVARKLQSIPLTLSERFTFCQAPANTRSEEVAAALKQYAIGYASRTVVPLNVNLPLIHEADPAIIAILEQRHSIVDLYLWLAQRYPDTFTEIEEALKVREVCSRELQRCLIANASGRVRRKREK